MEKSSYHASLLKPNKDNFTSLAYTAFIGYYNRQNSDTWDGKYHLSAKQSIFCLDKKRFANTLKDMEKQGSISIGIEIGEIISFLDEEMYICSNGLFGLCGQCCICTAISKYLEELGENKLANFYSSYRINNEDKIPCINGAIEIDGQSFNLEVYFMQYQFSKIDFGEIKIHNLTDHHAFKPNYAYSSSETNNSMKSVRFPTGRFDEIKRPSKKDLCWYYPNCRFGSRCRNIHPK